MKATTTVVVSAVRFFLLAAAVLATGSSAFAAAGSTWSGTTNGLWGTATNWSGSTLPATSGTLTFGSAGTSGALTLTDNLMTPGTYTVTGITFSAGAAAFVINPNTVGTNGFTLGGNVTNSSTSLETINDIMTLTAARTFTMTTGGGNITLGGALSGAGQVISAGTGTLTLSGNNSSLTGVNVTSGVTESTSLEIDSTGSTVVLASNTAAGGGAIYFAVNGTLSSGTFAPTISNTLFLANGGAATITGSSNLTENGLFVLGGGSPTVTINNTGTTFFAGGIHMNDNNGSGRTLIFKGSGYIDVDSAIINGSGGAIGALTYNGTNTLFLSGANTYTGATTITTGTIDFSTAASLYNSTNSALGASATAGNLPVASGATAAFGVGGAGYFSASEINSLITNANATFASGSTVGFDTTNATGGFTYGNVIANNNAGANMLGVTALGTGTLNLTNAASTYTGVTTVTGGGVLNVGTFANGGSPSSIGASTNVASNLILNGGTIQYTGTTAASTNRAFTFGALGGTIDGSGTGTGTLTISGNPVNSATSGTETLTLTNSVSGGLGGTLSGNLVNGTGSTTALTVTGNGGTGTWALTGTNTYTGPTAVSGATLSLAGSGATPGSLGGTAITVTSGGTLQIGSAGTTTTATTIGTAGSGAVTINGGTLSLANGAINTLNINNVTSGATALTIGSSGGTLDLEAGGTTADQIALGSGLNAVFNGPININLTLLGTVNGGGSTIDVPLISWTGTTPSNNGFNLTTTGASPGFYGLSLSLLSNGLDLVETPLTSAYWLGGQNSSWATGLPGGASNFTTDSGGTTNRTAVLDSNTAVIFAASGANPASYSNTTLDQSTSIYNLIYNVGGVGIYGGTGSPNTLTIANGITVASGLGATTETIDSTVNVALGGSQTWAVAVGGSTGDAATTLLVNGNISGTGYGLTKTGVGVLALGGANSYTGATLVSGGVLSVQSTGALAGTSGVSVASGATLQLQVSPSTATPMTLSGSGIALAGALENTSGTNTYNGAITVGSGGATIGADTGSSLALSTTANIGGSNNLTLTGGGTGSVAGIIGTGSGSLTMNGTGTWTLTGANSYSGGTIVNAGTLTVGTGGTLGATTGALAVNNPNTGAGTNVVLNLPTAANITTGSLSGTVATPSGGTNTDTINIGPSQTLTVNQTAAGSFGGVLSGTGSNFTLSSSSTGTLTLSGSITGTNVTVNGGALTESGSGTISGSGATLTVGGGTVTLANANTFSGATTVNSGALDIANANALQNSTLTLNGGALQISNNITTNSAFGVTLSGTGVGSKGALESVSGTNTFAGLITLGTGGASIGSDSGSTLTLNSSTTLAGGGNALTLVGAGNGTLASGINSTLASLTMSGTGNWSLTGNYTYSGAVTVGSGTLTLSGNEALSGTVTLNGGTLTLSGTDPLSGSVISNGGTLNLGSNSISGSLAINTGTFNFSSVTGFPSSIGLGSGTNTAGLNYTGSTAGSVSSPLTFAGTTGTITLSNSGTAAINYTGTPVYSGVGVKTIDLGNTNDTAGGSITAITNTTSSNAVSVVKAGQTDSTWTIGTASYTGNTTVNGGVLQEPILATTSGLNATEILTVADLTGNPTTSNLAIFQSSGTLDDTIHSSGATAGQINWENYSGFAANGGNLIINATNATSATSILTWGVNASGASFVSDGANTMLTFGSSTANGQVELQNAFSLCDNGNTSGTPRTIFVDQGTGGDSALLSGIISDPMVNATAYNASDIINKQGNGTLILSGANTYNGTALASNNPNNEIVGNTFSGVVLINAGTLVAAGSSSSAPPVTNVNVGTGGFALGATTIPVSSVTGLSVGQVITVAGTANGAFGTVQQGTYITAINSGADTVTLSQATLKAGTAGTNLVFGTPGVFGIGYVSTGAQAIPAPNTTGAPFGAVNTVTTNPPVFLAAENLTTLPQAYPINMVDNNSSPSLIIGGGGVNGSDTTAGNYTIYSPVDIGFTEPIAYNNYGLLTAETVAVPTTGTYSIGGNTTSTSTFAGLISTDENFSVTQTAGGTLNITGGITSDMENTASTVTFANAGSVNVSSAIGVTGVGTGTLAVTQSGTGTTTLSAVNTYTGATTISGTGQISIGSGGSISTSSGVSITSTGTFDISGGGNQTIGDLSGVTGSSVTLGSNVLTLGTANTTTFAGGISGSGGGLTKQGNGTLNLTGTYTYTGPTIVNAGTLALGGSGTFGSSSVTVNGGSFTENSATTISGTVDVAGGSAVLAGAAGNIDVTGGSFTDTGSITGSVSVSGTGTASISGTSSYTGATMIGANSTLSTSSLSSLGSTSGVSLASGSTFQYTGTGTDSTSAPFTVAPGATGDIEDSGGASLTLSGTLTKANGVLEFSGASNSVFDVTGQITGGTTSDFNSDLDVNGVTVVLDNSNDNYTGPTNVYNGGTLEDGVGTMPAGTVLTLGASGDGAVTNTFDLHGDNQTIGALDSVSNGGNTNLNVVTDNGANATLTLSGLNSDSGSVSSNFGGVIQNGSGITSLAVTGGTHTLTGANTYTGTTTVSGGTLNLNANGAAGGTSTVNITAGTLAVGSGTTNAINSTAAVNITAGGTLAVNNGASQTIGALTLLGTGASHINFGTDSSTTVLTLGSDIGTWDGGATLDVDDWTSGTTEIVLGSVNGSTDTTAGFSPAELSDVTWTGGSDAGVTGAEVVFTGGHYELQPNAVPEPTTIFAGLGLLALLGWRNRRQIIAALS